MVLATNRALDTVISRKPRGERFIPLDLMDTYKIGKFKALFAGLVPTVFFYFLVTTSVYRQTYTVLQPDPQAESESEKRQTTW